MNVNSICGQRTISVTNTGDPGFLGEQRAAVAFFDEREGLIRRSLLNNLTGVPNVVALPANAVTLRFQRIDERGDRLSSQLLNATANYNYTYSYVPALNEIRAQRLTRQCATVVPDLCGQRILSVTFESDVFFAGIGLPRLQFYASADASAAVLGSVELYADVSQPQTVLVPRDARFVRAALDLFSSVQVSDALRVRLGHSYVYGLVASVAIVLRDDGRACVDACALTARCKRRCHRARICRQ